MRTQYKHIFAALFGVVLCLLLGPQVAMAQPHSPLSTSSEDHRYAPACTMHSTSPYIYGEADRQADRQAAQYGSQTTAMQPRHRPVLSPAAMRSDLSAVGADTPYPADNDRLTDGTSGPRRVGPGGGIGEPGAEVPLGDLPYPLLAAFLLLYALLHHRRSLRKQP